jgi:hypothetical protein
MRVSKKDYLQVERLLSMDCGSWDRANHKVKTNEQLGRHLRDLYQDVLYQPLPERFRELLNWLEEPESR